MRILSIIILLSGVAFAGEYSTSNDYYFTPFILGEGKKAMCCHWETKIYYNLSQLNRLKIDDTDISPYVIVDINPDGTAIYVKLAVCVPCKVER